MAPSTAQQFLLSPAELSYLHESLSLVPPVRPDGRTPTEFRPLVAESGLLPAVNGSARVCFADGTEAIVGVKAEVEKSQWRPGAGEEGLNQPEDDDDDDVAEGSHGTKSKGTGESSWVETSIEVPGYRDDDALPVFLSAMLTEALVADGKLKDRLYLNRRFHWKLFIDVRTQESLSHMRHLSFGRPDVLTSQDIAALGSANVPSTAAFHHYTSRPAFGAAAQTQIRGR